MRDHTEIVRRIYSILCSYKAQSEEFYEFLLENMTGEYIGSRKVFCKKGDPVPDAVFISDGYMACYGFDSLDLQVLSLYWADMIVAGKSFTDQSPSEFEWVFLPDTYVMKISHGHMAEVYNRFPEAEELARLVMADNAEREQKRLQLLKRDAESVIIDFYTAHPKFLSDNILNDVDLASYLLISESTLRNVRARLLREGRL